MVVINPEIFSLQAKINEKLDKCFDEQSSMQDDFEKLNYIIMDKTVDELDGTITEHLPKSKDNPTRSMTEKDRQELYDLLYEKYFMS